MKTMRLLSAVAVLAMGACGGDDSGTGTPDAGVVLPDAPANLPDGAPVCSVNPSYTVQAIVGDATNMISLRNTPAGANTPEVDVMGVGLNQDQDGFQIEMYSNAGVFQAAGGIKPGTYQLTGAELNYATCGLCVRFFGDATQAAPGADFMATAGTVNITELGAVGTGRFKATLSGVTFEHVTIDPNTFTSTPVGDNCNTAFGADVSIDVPVVAAMKPGQPGSGHTFPSNHIHR